MLVVGHSADPIHGARGVMSSASCCMELQHAHRTLKPGGVQ